MAGPHSVKQEPAVPAPEVAADPAPASRPERFSRVSTWLYGVFVTVILAAGAAGAIRVWLSDRGFWNDELYIAASLRALSVRGLFGPLRYYQVAPPGWLVTEKGLLTFVGDSEQILRFPSMVAAVATMILGVVLARRAVGQWASLLAAVLLVSSPLLLSYAGELKQYTTEAAVALLLLVAADYFGADDRLETSRRRRALTWMVIGLVSAMLSYSAALMIVAIVCSMLLVTIVKKRWADMRAFIYASIPVVLLAGALVERRRMLPALSNQNSFFPTGFPPPGSGLSAIPAWLPRMWGGLADSPLNWAAPTLIFLLVVGGIVALLIRGRLLWAVMLAATFGVSASAAAVKGMPMQGRVSLYVLPVTVLCVVACVDGVIRGAYHAFTATPSAELWWARTKPMATAVGAVLAICTVLSVAFTAVASAPAFASGYAEVVNPVYRDPGRDVLRDVASRLKAGDKVLGYQFSKPLIAWYGRQLGLPIVGLAQLGPQKGCNPSTVDPIFTGAQRIWYVHGAPLTSHPTTYNERVVAYLAQHGRVVESKQARPNGTSLSSAGWTLVDLSAGPGPKTAPLPAIPAFSCLTILPPPTY